MAIDVRMMPGQEPYTQAELEDLYNLIGQASRAEDLIPYEELEEVAR